MSGFTQADLAAIDDAIASGYLEVKYEDKTVKYQTTDDLLKARALILSQLNPAQPAIGFTQFAYARDYE